MTIEEDKLIEAIAPVPRKIEHVSFSSIKDWKTCGHYFKLTRVDGLPRGSDSIHTAFGKAVHGTLEEVFKQERQGTFDYSKDFTKRFKELLGLLDKEIFVKIAPKDLAEFEKQGKELVEIAYDETLKFFGEFEYVAAEEELFEEIEEYTIDDYQYKGFIDLILRRKSDGMFIIIDWKTSGWGWDAKKKSDTMLSYQLSYYKHFYAKKYKIPPDKFETFFGILKRTGKEGERVEFLRVTSGPKKIQNALKVLTDTVHSIDHSRFFKNKMSCGPSRCPYRHTEHCSR